MKKGFTLAEVLITLVIIGVIAALTIPALLNNTNNEEYRTAGKKAYATLNQALQQHYALTGEDWDELNDRCSSNSCLYTEFFSKRMNIVSSMNPSSATAATGNHSYDDGELTMYGADGIAYTFDGGNWLYVDVNGDKGPNQVSMSTDDIKDGGYTFKMGRSNTADYEGMSVVPDSLTQKILFGGDYSESGGGDYYGEPS
ncbi:MAG: type II secretion system protein [Candidatus Gastranaerophilales bacterium]|nr:type II secretion system protein [Candidatus Gastranaerophilales bacterium]